MQKRTVGDLTYEVFGHAEGGGHVQCTACTAQMDHFGDSTMNKWMQRHATPNLGMFGCRTLPGNGAEPPQQGRVQ